MNIDKIINNVLLEIENDQQITLYHGTCKINSQQLLKNGWKPNSSSQGSNMGQTKYLYVTTEPEDAMWFANQKGCNSIIEITTTIDNIIPDPEDEAGYTKTELLNDKSGMARKFVIFKPISKSQIKLVR